MKKFIVKTEAGTEFEMEVDEFLEIDVAINNKEYTISIKEK